MKNALALLQEPLAETLHPQLVEEHHLMSLDEAIRNIHFPKNHELLRKAQYRLKFEELFYVQLNICLLYTSCHTCCEIKFGREHPVEIEVCIQIGDVYKRQEYMFGRSFLVRPVTDSLYTWQDKKQNG